MEFSFGCCVVLCFCMKLFMGMLFMLDLSKNWCAKCFILFVIVCKYASFWVFSSLRFGMFNIFRMYFVWRTSHCLCFWPAVISACWRIRREVGWMFWISESCLCWKGQNVRCELCGVAWWYSVPWFLFGWYVVRMRVDYQRWYRETSRNF